MRPRRSDRGNGWPINGSPASSPVQNEATGDHAVNDHAVTDNAVTDDAVTDNALIDRAVHFHPSYARGWYVSGLLRLMAGDIDRAIEDIERSGRLSPRDPVGTQSMMLGIGHFFARRFEIAARELELTVQERPLAALGYRFLAACYAHLGRLDEARSVVDRLRRFAPVLSEDMSWRRAEDHELLVSGLRLAMGASSGKLHG